MIPWRSELTGDHQIPDGMTIREFVEEKEIAWDQEALVTVNDRIVQESYVLKEGDHIYLLVPVVGG
ncbi:MAG: MoaD/ThiS family protein [Bacillaceae bacterium]|nr:MoaD/ThiS family protein [Bacillaceae bacterium]